MNLKVISRTMSVLIVVGLLFQPWSVLAVHAAPGDITLISADLSGGTTNGGSYDGKFSGDARYVVFASGASDLVAGDTNNFEDVFVRDRLAGATVRASLATLTGEQGNNGSGNTTGLSSDGRFVVFESDATNLVSVDTNGLTDVFVRDLQTGVTTLVSVDSAGVQANDLSEGVSISGDGRYVVFNSAATNLVLNDTNESSDIFVHDMQTGQTLLASVDSSGVQANTGSYEQMISTNGRYVLFTSSATNLVVGDINGRSDIFVHDLQTGETSCASVNSTGQIADKGAWEPSISADGRYVSFSSYAENLMSEDTLNFEQVYVRDRLNGTTTVLSYDATYGHAMYGLAEESTISDDGRYVAFTWDDKGDGMPTRWVYVFDRLTYANTSMPGAVRLFLSSDGRFVGFDTAAGNLVPGDANNDQDVFVREISLPTDLNPTVFSIQPQCSGSACPFPSGPNVSFNVTFSEVVTGVTADDFALSTTGGISGAYVSGVIGFATQYVVNVNTGSGDGTLRLDVVDDDSIKDSTQNPLGGAGIGNGNFAAGGVFVVDNSIAQVISSTRLDPNPTAAPYVNFAVTFSEDVTGVDALDFNPYPGGNLSGFGVVEVTGSGSAYNVKVATGSGEGTLRLNVIDNDSIVDSNGHPIGGAGPDNGTFTQGEDYTINRLPTVFSSLRLDPNPTNSDTVHFIVNFTEAVSGVDTTDFALATTGNLSVAAIIGVDTAGPGTAFTVTAAIGSGNGTVRLDVIDDDSIIDASGVPLGGAGAGTGSYSGGDAYTINKPQITVLSETYRSNGSSDGWVLESAENSEQGGSLNSKAPTFNLGDDAQNRQYRAILHFPTYTLPDNAVVTQVILMIFGQGIAGTNPFMTHGNINIDLHGAYLGSPGIFGFNSLDLTDFQAPASKPSAGTITDNPVGGWYWSLLDNSANPYISLTGVTQLRLMFQTDDNNDYSDDFLSFFSGDYDDLRYRPHLYIEYYLGR